MDEDTQLFHTAKTLATEHRFYLSDDIDEIDPFYDLITTLRESGPDDCIFIHLNSPGGNLYTCLQLCHAIEQSNALVVGCADGLVASAASAIFFSCHAFQINPAAQFLIHSGAGVEKGKVSDLKSAVDFYHRQIEDWLATCYSRFFTEEELVDILRGREFYLTGKEVEDRISKALEEQEEEIEQDTNSDA
tara:strand:- start:3156 stop:3725 length:570 start_codon:yes stop_codon:yes gene_type:complete